MELRALGNEMAKVFGYLLELQVNVLDHANRFDDIKAWEKLRKDSAIQQGVRQEDMRQEVRRMQEIITANDEHTKKTLMENDVMIKDVVGKGMTEVWEFQRRNQAGLQEEFAKLESWRAVVEKELKQHREYLDIATAAGSRSSAPAPAFQVPVSPQGLTGCGSIKLREDLDMLEEKVALMEGQLVSLSGLQCPCLTDQ